MKKYILSIDQGTTSTRAILFDKKGQLVASANKEVHCFYLHSGWVESDALEIWNSVLEVVNQVIKEAKTTFKEIDSLGITNQRETTVVWQKSTGLPICNAIIWQSRQSQEICERYYKYKKMIHQKTGLLINPYFSASKIKFIMENVKGIDELIKNDDLLFGTIDTWLIYNLTEGKVHATDVSNASRTMLMNINTLSWDESLCKLFEIPKSMLPEIKQSSDEFGIASIFDDLLHIYGVAGDQQSALFGQNCFNKGDAKNTYGTGCFMLVNTGDKPVLSKNGLLTTVAWKINNQVTYALEGSVFIGGALVQWLRDGLKIINEASETEEISYSINDTEGVYIVPAFTGLGTPYWDNDVRGTIVGLTRNSGKAHIVRASLESICYQCKDVFDTISKETNIKFKSLKVDGGASANKYLMQFQSDILDVEINLPNVLETTALGAAYLAGLKSEFFKDCDDIIKIHTIKEVFKPNIDEEKRNKLYQGWKKAIKATQQYK